MMTMIRCDYCHREISLEEVIFELKMELYAAPDMPEITEEDLEQDHSEEIESLIEAMEQMDAEELTDEVYECYIFKLCNECRQDIHNKLKHNTDKKQIL